MLTYHVLSVFILSDLGLTFDLCDYENLIANNVSYYFPKGEPVFNCGCINKITCVKKCCANGFYVVGSVCKFDANYNFMPQIYKRELSVGLVNISKILVGGIGTCPHFALRPSTDHRQKFYVQENGTIWIPHVEKYIKNTEYCLDNLDKDGLSMLICADPDKNVIPRKINTAGMIISMPFLLATFVVYAILPERNLHMKALMFYVLCLLTGYICLVTIQLMPVKLEPGPCKTLGFVCIFSFILSFLWMNVICIDIWFTFSGFRAFSRSHKAERRRFIMYCAYSWGLAFIHFLVVFLINEFNTDNVWYSPKIGESMCFIQSGWPELFYFYGPMAVIIIVNITLFASTAWKIVKIKRDTSMLKKNDSKRHTYENDKQKFNLYLKLFLAMGVNWTMEVISWAVEWMIPDVKYVWIATDFCNAMYGVFIFFIFVFKKSTWKILKKRYYSFVGKPHLAHSMTTSSQTRTRDSECTTTEIALSETAVPREEMSLTKNHY